MKVNIYLLLILVLSFIIGISNVDAATYNGSAGIAGTTVTGGAVCSNNEKDCLWNNLIGQDSSTYVGSRFAGVRLMLVYSNGTSYTRIGTYFYVLRSNNNCPSDLGSSCIASGYDDWFTTSGGVWVYDSDEMKNDIIGKNEDDQELLEKWIKRFGTTLDALTKDSCGVDKSNLGNCYKKAGYRILIEPLLQLNSGYWYTAKEIAVRDNITNSQRYAEIATRLYTDFNDINIYVGSGTSVAASKTCLEDEDCGYGYNIIDITEAGGLNEKYDYRPDSICLNCDDEGTDWSYIYTDMANWDGIKTAVLSTKSSSVKNYFTSGSISGNTVACREQIRVKFPSQTDAIQVQTGRYFTVGLPQQYSINTPNFEPLTVERTKECRAYDSSGNDVTSSVKWKNYWLSDTFYQNASSSDNSKRAESTGVITLIYNEQNGSKNYNGEKATDVYNTIIDGENSNSLTVTNSYTLTADTYRYIRKDNGLSVSVIPTDVAYDDVGVANLPISFTNTADDTSSVAATLQFNYEFPEDSHLAAAFKDPDYFKGDALQSTDEDIYKVASSEGAISAGSDIVQQGGLDSDQFNDLKHTACALQYCSDSNINGSSTRFSCSGFGSCVTSKIKSGKTQTVCSSDDNYICSIDFDDGNTCRIEDGKYYDYNNNEISADEYNQICSGGNTCRIENGKYYDYNNNEISADEYNRICNGGNEGVCRIENGKYYIDEEEVTEAVYKAQCACYTNNGIYYIDGDEVTEEEYYRVCPPEERVCPDDDPCCYGYCDTSGGINVIYRTIDLNTPFPGYSAEKRDTGANWCYYNVSNKSLECGSGTYTSQTANEVVNQVIYENRGVTGDPESVYQEEPIYEVTLNADKISEIRSYNDDHAYSDFTLTCEADGTGCKLSSTVREMLEVSGVCASASGDSFYTCDE